MRTGPIILIVGGLILGACTGSSAAPEVTAPVPTTTPTQPAPSAATTAPSIPSSDPATTTTSSQPTTTVADTEPDPTEPNTTASIDVGRYLPDGLGTVVDSAPGVDSPGEVIELLDNVWFFVPSEPVEGDANIVPPLPEDQGILIAYAEAQAAYHDQASTNPVPTEPSPQLADALADGGQRLIDNVLAPAAEAGQYVDLSDGIVLRPVVIADPRSDTEAFIFDCQLDGTVLVNADGSLADGQIPGVKEFPQIASVVKVDGEWIVDRLTRDERACA